MGALGREGVRIVSLAQRSVRLAVGHVGPEAAVAKRDGPAAHRVGAELTQRRSRGALPAAALGLGQERERARDVDGEQVLFLLEAATILAAGDVGTVPAVLRRDLDPLGIGADDPGQRQQLQRVFEGEILGALRAQQGRGLGLVPVVGVLAELDVGAEPAVLEEHLEAGVRVDAQQPVATRRVEHLDRLLEGHLVGRHVLGNVAGLVLALEVGTEAADADRDLVSFAVLAEGEGVDLARVDLLELLGDDVPQTEAAGAVGPLAEVEALEPRNGLFGAARDLIQLVFHAGGERVVHQVREMVLEEAHHREGAERGDERVAALPGVAAIDDRLDDGGVGGGATDAELFEPPHQRRFGEPCRRLRLVALSLEGLARDRLAFGQRRQVLLLVVELGLGIVASFDVGAEEPRERDRVAARREHDFLALGAFAGQLETNTLTAGVLHLRGEGALPDQLVELGLVVADLLGHLLRGLPVVAGGADRLVRFLRVLDLLLVDPWRFRQVVVAVEVDDLAPGGRERRLRKRRRVRAHVRDEPVLVETLRGAHGPRGAEPELAAGLLLQRRRHERRGWGALVGLGDERLHREGAVGEADGQGLGARLVEDEDVVAFDLALGVEVLARREALVVDADEVRLDVTFGRAEEAIDVPVACGDEGDPRALALDDDPRRHALDATCAQPRHHFLPQHRRDLVAVEAIEDAPRLLGVDEPAVDVPRVVDGLLDRLAGDLVEHHPLDRHFGLEDLEQVPGDALSLAIFIGREQHFVRLLDQLLELADVGLLVRIEDVEGLEAVVDVDAEPRPGLLLVGCRDVARAAREVSDVADRGLDDVVVAEERTDGTGLGGGLDDHQRLGHGGGDVGPGP